MKRFIQYLLLTICFLIVISCTGRPMDYNYSGNTGGDFGGGGGTDCGTNSALVVSAVAAPQPATLVNGSAVVTVTVTAYGYCDKYRMTSPIEAPTTLFTRTQTFQKTYTAVGTYQMTVGVDALNNNNAVVDHKDINLTINVQSGDQPPGDPPPSTCNIERRGSVVNTNALAPVALVVTGTNTLVSSRINSVTVTPGATVNLGPVVPGIYNAIGDITDNLGRTSGCSFALQTPTNELEVVANSITHNSVGLKMTIHGPITIAKIDGVNQNLPTPPNNVIQITKPHTAGPGKFTSLGEVINGVTNDRGSVVSAEYCIPHQAIAAVGDTWTNTYYESDGYQISSTNNRIAAGYRWMNWTGSTWGVKALERDFNTQLKTTTTTTVPRTGATTLPPTGGQCPADYVIIGYTTANHNICAKLVSLIDGAKVKLINPTQQSNFINEGGASMFTCPAGQVLTGHDRYNYNNQGWRYLAYCATPVWEECQ